MINYSKYVQTKNNYQQDTNKRLSFVKFVSLIILYVKIISQ